ECSPPMATTRSPRLARLSDRLLLIRTFAFAGLLLAAAPARASETDLAIPDLHEGSFNIFGMTISAWWLLFWGALVICGTVGSSLYLRTQIHRLPAHRSMLNVADVIYQTCKTYLIQQGKFLVGLFVLIGAAITFYLLYSAGHGDEGVEGRINPY